MKKLDDPVVILISSLKYIGGGIVILLIGMIKIPKLELNIWGWLGRSIGRALNKELLAQIKEIQDDVDDIDKKLSDHIFYDERATVKAFRQKIIEFNDEILDNKKHTEESYNCILEDIDAYEHYCDQHPEFPNNKAVFAISNIKNTYQECLKMKQFR